jgi:uncharacterized protein (TIGR03067 family)
MKTLAPLCLLLCVAAAVADEAAKKDAKFDADKLVGQWTYTEGTRAGDKVDKERLAGTVKFTKDTVTIPAGPNEKFTIAYTIDAKASPATIDLEIKDGPIKEGKGQGIIAIEGDVLKFCYVPEGSGKRPTKFESTKDNGAFYFVLKREKAK